MHQHQQYNNIIYNHKSVTRCLCCRTSTLNLILNTTTTTTTTNNNNNNNFILYSAFHETQGCFTIIRNTENNKAQTNTHLAGKSLQKQVPFQFRFKRVQFFKSILLIILLYFYISMNFNAGLLLVTEHF